MSIRWPLFLVLAGILHAVDAGPARTEVLEEYGSKAPSTITIWVAGKGVERPGIYHLRPGCTLMHAVTLAGAPEADISQVTVLKNLDGGVRILKFTLDRKKRPALPEFTLHDGDMVMFYDGNDT